MFGNLFRRRGAALQPASAPQSAEPPAAAAPANAAAPGTAIHYHAELIPKLKSDHRVLLELFSQVKLAYSAGRHGEAATLLGRFRSALQDHLLVESVRLYVYLEHQMREDAASFALIHDFRHEMDGIGKVAVGFLTKYSRLGQDPKLAETFGEELDAVGRVLVDRIQREESVLYPMYEA